jgi:hypothetical protein
MQCASVDANQYPSSIVKSVVSVYRARSKVMVEKKCVDDSNPLIANLPFLRWQPGTNTSALLRKQPENNL